MSEDEWLESSDPAALLGWLEVQLRLDQRKLRLFVCGACRLGWPRLHPQVRHLVEATEDLIDQKSYNSDGWPISSQAHDALLSLRRESLSELDEEVRSLACWAQYGVGSVRDCLNGVRAICPPATQESLASVIREMFGNPFRKILRVSARLQARVQTWPRERRGGSILLVRDWGNLSDGLVTRMARDIYQSRSFEQMPYLADALIDAGCQDEILLEHCGQPRGHLRGCWLLDLILAKDR